MKVCHLIDHTEAGGAQRVVLDLIEARRDSIDVSVLTLRGERRLGFSERMRIAGATVRSLDLRRLDPAGLVRFFSALKRAEVDVIHAHLDYSTTFGIALALMSRAEGSVVISHLHNDPWRHNGPGFRLGSRLVARRIDAHLVPSPSVLQAVSTAVGDRLNRLDCIELGIDEQYFNPRRFEEHAGLELRRGAKRVIGFIGRLVPQKRIDVLLAAVPRLLAAEPSTRILIVGHGPLRRQLESLCRDLRIADAVDFIEPRQEIVEAYLAMDVFCLPSDFEGFGLVLAEAMALGIPVVATRVSGVCDVVEHEKTGLLVSPDSPNELANAILKILDNREFARAIRDRAARHVRANLTRSRMTARVESLYDELVNGKRRHY